jgi:hypothetical protein
MALILTLVIGLIMSSIYVFVFKMVVATALFALFCCFINGVTRIGSKRR